MNPIGVGSILGLAVAVLLVTLMFRPEATSRANPVDDKATVTALDTQYQAAVKANDATTLDRILADDFVLVTGSGKTYSKSDLLEDAKSGRVHYDHQEDS